MRRRGAGGSLPVSGMGRTLTLALAVALASVLGPGASARSLASLGYTVLRWLDRAEIVRHDLSVEVDPAGLTARFADDVTFVSAGAGDLYVLLGADAVLERVSGPEGQDVAFSRAYGWLSLPFAVYRIASPGIERGREFSLRFEWHVTPGTVRFVNPFVALHFFHLGFDALWYPHMPGEQFFHADVRVTVPAGYRAIADGELVGRETVDGGARERFHFRTPVPVMGMGLAVGRFREAAAIEAAPGAVIEAWAPVGWISSVDRAARDAAAALGFFQEKLGPLPVERFYVAELPFPGGASYPSLYGLAYGGDLSFLEPPDETRWDSDLILAYLVAHETAHKWLGGMVGTPVVGSAWLSEGLADYLAYLALAAMKGEETSASLLYAKAYRPYVEGARGRPRALSAVELFDDDRDVLYQKGTLVFRMLHRRLGDEAFFALIRSFIHHHAGRVVTGQEFIDFADAFVREAGAAGAAGVHEPAGLRAFFDQWIKGTQTLDYALQVLEAGEAHLAFRVVSRGRLVEPGQVPVEVQLENGARLVQWAGLDETVTLELPARPVLARLDPDHWLADADPANNVWQAP